MGPVCHIYLIEHSASGKAYVGQTRNCPEKRWAQHGKADSVIGRALREFGADAFSFRVVETVPLLDANECERLLMLSLNSVEPGGFNSFRGSTSVRAYEASPATVEKKRLARLGKKLSDDHRAAVAAANRRKAKDPTICAKISLAKKGKPISEATLAALRARKGRKLVPCSDEKRRRISIARKIGFATRNGIGVFA